MTTTSHFDHASHEVTDELYEWRHRVDEETGWTYSDAYGGFWIVSRFEDVLAIAKDNARFSSASGITIPPLENPIPSIPAESDEPWHKHYRQVLAQYLTPAAVRRYDGMIRKIVTDCLDKFAARGEADFVAELASVVPTLVTGVVFGFELDEAAKFGQGFRDVLTAAGSGDPAEQEAAVGSFIGLLKSSLADRREHPRDDIISAIVQYEAEGRPFTEEECIGLLWSTAGASIDTTVYAIGHALRMLDRFPAIRQQLISDPSAIPVAVEESLRLNAPAFALARVVVEPVAISGVELRPGERVLLMYGWANYDEAVFTDPDHPRLDRGPNPHCAFGKGIHTCVGMHLARLEVRIVLEEILTRIPDYELAAEPDRPTLHGGLMWGYDSLPGRFTAEVAG
jgi:cytochrome P450